MAERFRTVEHPERKKGGLLQELLVEMRNGIPHKVHGECTHAEEYPVQKKLRSTTSGFDQDTRNECDDIPYAFERKGIHETRYFFEHMDNKEAGRLLKLVRLKMRE